MILEWAARQGRVLVTHDVSTLSKHAHERVAAGQQLWDFKDGTLRGDRPHLLKIYGTRSLPWRASVGAFFVAQSGQPWEVWSFEPYRTLTTSTSDVNRYAEPAGSRRTDAHWQLDLQYAQNVKLGERVTFQVVADLFNVFDKQAGYNIQNQRVSARLRARTAAWRANAVPLHSPSARRRWTTMGPARPLPRSCSAGREGRRYSCRGR